MILQEELDYTFQLPAFEGPLDLLLKLIEREELDITEIALAQVAELARQLREYQRYKQAAALLRAWEEVGRRSYMRVAPPVVPAQPRDSKLDVTLSDMLAAVQRRMQLLLPLEPPEVPLPAPKVVTVPEMAERIRERLALSGWISFDDLLSLAAHRLEVIVALWAVLELLKRRAIVVDQADVFGPIMIGRGPKLNSTELHELEIDE